nr:uncharacterized protein LOC109189836 [Ipomoea batatas]
MSRIPPPESSRRLADAPQPDRGKCFVFPVHCSVRGLVFFVRRGVLRGWGVGDGWAHSGSLWGGAFGCVLCICWGINLCAVYGLLCNRLWSTVLRVLHLLTGSKARKIAPSNFAPVASLSGGTVPSNAHVPSPLEIFPSMHTRALGKLLVDANKLLTTGQRRTVIDMGFGTMLNFQIADTPLRLGHWLLSNLDIDSMQLKLPNGLALNVDEEAAEAVFGLPRGPKVMTDRAKHQKSVILNSWRESYEKVDYTITPVEVDAKLEKYPDGGEYFIRNYALLVVSTVVRTMQNGYVYQHVIPNLKDTLEIGNLNWCQYVIYCLIATQPAWKAKKTQRFTGPLVFLTVLYVDRVRAGVCTVPRTLPAFVGWDVDLLKQREESELTSGGFGRGSILEPMQPKKKDLRVRVTEQARLVAPGILHLVELLHEAEMEANQSDQTSKLFNTARSLVGIHPTLAVHAHAPPSSVSTDGTELDDDFYSNPDVLKAVEEIEHAVHKRNALYNEPSFNGVVLEDAVTTTVREMTNNVTSEERASGMSTRSKTKHNGVNPSAQPSSSGPPIRPPHSIRGNGVTTAPQVVAQVPGNPLSTTTHQTGSTPHIVPKPSSLANHPPTPIVTNQSLHMGSVDVIEHAVQERDVLSDVPSFSLGFTQDGGTSPLRQTTTFANSQQHASVITTPNATPARLHHSLTDDGVTTTPQGTCAAKSTETTPDRKASSESSSHKAFTPWEPLEATEILHVPTFTETLPVPTFTEPVSPNIAETTAPMSTIQERRNSPFLYTYQRRNRQGETKDKLYGQTPKHLVDMLSTFLDDKLETEIASNIRDLIPKRMQMSWRVPKNQVDSAVFTMRHMESYRGQGVANWDVGLQRGNYMQICVLRQYFMREILMSDINIHQNSNIKRARNFANGLARNTTNIV